MATASCIRNFFGSIQLHVTSPIRLIYVPEAYDNGYHNLSGASSTPSTYEYPRIIRIENWP